MPGRAPQRSQLAALVADRWGVTRRLPGGRTLLDEAQGRYLLTRSMAQDGTQWTTVAPADPHRLGHRVEELLDAAVAAARC